MGVGPQTDIRRSIAVIGTQSPARSLAMAKILDDCIARHGWSERLSVRVSGFGPGAGLMAPAESEHLAAAGWGPSDRACPALESSPELVEAADYLVVGSDEEANLFIQWPGAEGKPVLAFCDFADPEASVLNDPRADLASFCHELVEAVPSLLRSIVAAQ